jgi:hypothetical protein
MGCDASNSSPIQSVIIPGNESRSKGWQRIKHTGLFGEAYFVANRKKRHGAASHLFTHLQYRKANHRFISSYFEKHQMKVVVIGIHTGIGKTFCSTVLVEALQADYWKPIQAGDLENSDTLFVKNHTSLPKGTITRRLTD